MPVPIIPLADTGVIIALLDFLKADIQNLQGFYDMNGVYVGTEVRMKASQDRIIQVATQITLAGQIHYACYPLSIFASVVMPFGG